MRYWMNQENIPLEQLLVIVDDIALPFGTIRMKGKGSDAGHNGLKHIQEILGTQNYARIKFGIGNDFPKGYQVEYVLGQFTPEQRAELPKRIEVAIEMVKCFCLAGLNNAMNQYNNK